MTRPSTEEIAAAQAILDYLSSSSDDSAYAVGAELQRFFQHAIEERDVEWCKMLGFPEAGAPGNTPEFIRRELKSYHEEPDTAVAVRAAIRAESKLWHETCQGKRDFMSDDRVKAVFDAISRAVETGKDLAKNGEKRRTTRHLNQSDLEQQTAAIERGCCPECGAPPNCLHNPHCEIGGTLK